MPLLQCDRLIFLLKRRFGHISNQLVHGIISVVVARKVIWHVAPTRCYGRANCKVVNIAATADR